jgi:biotin-dependent carboxylase-like uncharacterized protein
MIAGLKVLAPGLATTVQDLGRYGFQAIGVPVSGALDPVALRLGNALVGNPAGTAALEILLRGPRLEVVAEAVRVAAAGPGAMLDLAGEGMVPGWRSVTLRRGAMFEIVPGRECLSCIMAVEGGIAVPAVLGSASTYVPGRLGGLDGRALRAGDILPLAIAAAPPRPELRLHEPPGIGRDEPIRIVLGPQQDAFAEAAVATLLGGDYRVSANADRMGMRLDGPRLDHRAGWDIVSDAIPAGAIQVPGSGQPILLLADHQTTGGYPKIATVVSADLPRAGRRRPGDTIRFTAVSAEEAEALYRAESHRLDGLAAALAPVRDLDLSSLYDRNLISGVFTVEQE